MSERPNVAHFSSAGVSAARAWLDDAAERVRVLIDGQEGHFEAAVEAIRACIERDALIYIFGTGHSHVFAEEGHYRAGGLACVVPILASGLMLHEGATASSRTERLSGLAEIILSRYPIGPGDVTIVFSTSGVNAVPVEAARVARAAGATVIGVSSEAYSRRVAAGRTRLSEVVSIALDNHAAPGDAAFSLTASLSSGPVSTIVGAALLNALFVEAEARLVAAGIEPPVYVSGNMPGAAQRNAELIARYRARNPHL